MAVSFTKEQQQAIDLHHRDILVSAAAGSGKTAVLVERIIKMITEGEDPVDIDRLLVVTFTEAAAAEMRERIRKALDVKLSENPENVHLQKQEALLYNAKITTIHSFCLFVIRNNFNDIGLDPGFRIADEGELTLMSQDVLTELLEEEYAKADPAFLSMVDYFTGGSDDRQLEEMILSLYRFSMSCPWPEEWLLERKTDYLVAGTEELKKLPWYAYLMDLISCELQDICEDMKETVRLCQLPEGPWFYGELMERELEQVEKICAADSYDRMYELFETLRFDRLPSKKDESVNVSCREKAKDIRTDVKAKLQGIKDSYFPYSMEQTIQKMAYADAPVECLLLLVLAYKKRLDQKKRDENIIDFNDMEHFALQILVQKEEDGSYHASTAAKEYQNYFAEILIDEYQDSNLVQELLLKSISGEEKNAYNRFMVGDVKQSIYKFRQARPELFIEKYNCYSNEDSDRQRIDLHKNFRSRKEVIDSINEVFYRIMKPRLGGIEYDDAAALYAGADYPAGKENETELLLIEKGSDDGLSKEEQEALLIAGRIRELYASFLVTDKTSGELRPLRYSDIVILLRSPAGMADAFRRILEKEGIPSFVTSKTGYFQAAEVRELLKLLQVLNNPMQDIPLYGTMKSFFGGFEEEEIARIRSFSGKQELLYENLLHFEENENKEIKSKINKFMDKISKWRQMASYTPIHSLIQAILTETGYLEYVSAKAGGEQRRANLEMLLVRAAAFEGTSYYGLFHFLRYIDRLDRYQVDYGEAEVVDENADLVRIMSIHKSKGLEFPVCFVAGLSKQFNFRDTTGRLIADIDLGIGTDFIDQERRIQSRTLRKNVVAAKMKLDVLAEEMRVLYVAMTRAKEKLILTGLVNNKEKTEQVLSDPYRQEEVLFGTLTSASCYLDFVLPCITSRTQEKGVFHVTIQKMDEFVQAEVMEGVQLQEQKRLLLMPAVNQKVMTELSERISREYPFQYLSKLFVKTTVSELKMPGLKQLRGLGGAGEEAMDEAFTDDPFPEKELSPYIPDFVKEKEPLSGTDRGSAYHRVMELLDYEALTWKQKASDTEGVDGNLEELRSQLEQQFNEMEASGRLSSMYRGAVAPAKFLTFLQTDLAQRMKKAAEKQLLYREQPFVLGLSASRLSEEFPDSEMVLVQGIIDAFFEEDGEIVVVDYKTDRVDEEAELIRRYKVQLDYYAETLERLTGKQVKEKLIYSFALSKEIRIDK